MYHALKFSIGVINGLRLQNYAKRQNKWFEGGTGAEIRLRLWRLEMKFKLKWHWCISGKIWALQYDNGEEVALLYTEKDTVRWDQHWVSQAPFGLTPDWQVSTLLQIKQKYWWSKPTPCIHLIFQPSGERSLNVMDMFQALIWFQYYAFSDP